MSERPIKVMIIDDSALVRQVIHDLIADDPAIEVIGAASNPVFAQRQLDKQWPDVFILDVEMPQMDGLTFLRKVMTEHPTPVVMCSSLTAPSTEVTLEALALGAVEIISKPELGIKNFLEESKKRLIDAVKSASVAHVTKAKKGPGFFVEQPRPPATEAKFASSESVVVIGASTGGTQAIEVILRSLPRSTPGIVIVQHMPEHFTAAFSERLNKFCTLDVKEAQNQDRVLPGQALIAPGNYHTQLTRSGAQFYVKVSSGPLINRHRPSVDVLFRSAAKQAGNHALGIILTGMGDDGAAGLLEMKQAGSHCIAQNEETSIVYGMPAKAVQRGAVHEILPLEKIAETVLAFSQRTSKI